MPNKNNIAATPNLPKKANLSVQRKSTPELAKLAPESETGAVNFTNAGKSAVTIGNQLYPLFYLTHKRKVFDALKREIERTGNNTRATGCLPQSHSFS